MKKNNKSTIVKRVEMMMLSWLRVVACGGRWVGGLLGGVEKGPWYDAWCDPK